MKKFRHENQLIKKALEVGLKYAKQRGYDNLEPGTPQPVKIEVVYRLLVQDKQITALPTNREDGPNMKHKLVIWISKMLPKDHEWL
ncbi:DUF5062 family protein [Thaumasiovibrio sp. DFM-14]|uniref:DUF5062 family protein n=1 Tax=Thaumasiovibrio sp. DFM-14 TaxID=3384792 RepID=UPI0039A09859